MCALHLQFPLESEHTKRTLTGPGDGSGGGQASAAASALRSAPRGGAQRAQAPQTARPVRPRRAQILRGLRTALRRPTPPDKSAQTVSQGPHRRRAFGKAKTRQRQEGKVKTGELCHGLNVPRNSLVDALTLNVLVSGGGPVGGDQDLMRVGSP